VLFPSQTAINLDEFREFILNKQNESTDSNQNQIENLITKDTNIKESEVNKSDTRFHVIVIDGTWSQASGIYYSNQHIQNLKTVRRNLLNL
jgi:hypothetical protein